MKSLQYRFLELNLFLKHCILCECSCYCAFEEKAGIAGNKRCHNKYTLNVKYKALMEIGRGVTNEDVTKKFNASKKHNVHVEKEQGQNSHCIQEQWWN